jgi:hypothetical protein
MRFRPQEPAGVALMRTLRPILHYIVQCIELYLIVQD